MKLCLPFVIAIIDFAAGQEAENFYRTDYTYVREFNAWFKFHRAPLPWRLARRRCENEGAKLASPMNNTYTALFREVMSLSNVDAMYTGAHTIFSHEEFYTVDGIPYMEVSQNMWGRGGLTYSLSDRCAIIDRHEVLASVSCDEDHPFLCFKAFARLNITECGTTDPEYKFNKSTGSCYKLHRSPEDWRAAFQVCSAEGGYLSVPNDAGEAQLLADLAAHAGDTHVGYFNWGQEYMKEEWYTVHGDPITYAHWEEPTNRRDSNCCVIQEISALLSEINCDDKKPFICEKDPKRLTMIRKVDPIE